MLDDDVEKPSEDDQKVADAMMDELEALMKPGTVYVCVVLYCTKCQQFSGLFCFLLASFCLELAIA